MANFRIKRKVLLKKIKPPSENNNIIRIIFRNWLFQGMALMDLSELCFRFLVELLSIALVLFLTLNVQCDFNARLIFSTFLVHTIFWTFNGHFWALHIGQKRLAKNTPSKTCSYLLDLKKRVNSYKPIDGCIIFGSMARNSFHEHSDIDIVFSAKCNLTSKALTFTLASLERAIAFTKRIPVEIYCYDVSTFSKEDAKECPIILKDKNDKWKSKMNNYQHFDHVKAANLAFFKDHLTKNDTTDEKS